MGGPPNLYPQTLETTLQIIVSLWIPIFSDKTLNIPLFKYIYIYVHTLKGSRRSRTLHEKPGGTHQLEHQFQVEPSQGKDKASSAGQGFQVRGLGLKGLRFGVRV